MLRYFLLEEYRRHVYLAKKFSVFLFPLYGMISTMVAAFFLPYILAIFSYVKFLNLTLIGSFLYGFGVSSFEFLGRSREKNSMISVSASLPLTPRKIYFYVFLRDVIYYSLLFILPVYSGLLLSVLYTPLIPLQVSIFTFSLFLSMLLGYSLGYLSFAVDSRWKAGYLILISLIVVYLILYLMGHLPFPVAMFHVSRSLFYLLLSFTLLFLFILLAYFLTPKEIAYSQKHARYSLPRYHRIFHNILVAKGFEDAIRGGIIIKSLFTYFFPMLLIFVFVRIINMASSRGVYNSFSMSIILSLFSVVIYSWLTVLDDVDYLKILPYNASHVIYAYIRIYLIIVTIISLPFLIFFSLASLPLLIPSIGIFYVNTLYLISIAANISGYRIHSLLFNPGIVMRFTLYTFVPGVILLGASIDLNIYSIALITVTSLFMLLLAYMNLKKINEKWVYF